jgi:uncharacterized protein YcbX
MASANSTVAALWRYPVKSMQGEELNATEINERGLRGDRTYALIDTVDGHIASAKNPRKWPRLFDFRAEFARPGDGGAVWITLPDGTQLSGEQADREARLSAAIGRPVTLAHAAPPAPVLEEYWPDIDGLPHRDAVTSEAMGPGTFFDLATIHLLTTATLDRLRALYPAGRFEVRRFRPNIVVATDGADGFVEQQWVGKTLALGDAIRLEVMRPCGRCVMTTLAQSDLPRDNGILRTAVQHAQGNVGVYARVVRGGTLRRGDAVRVDV